MSSSILGFNGTYQIHGGKMTKKKRSARAHDGDTAATY